MKMERSKLSSWILLLLMVLVVPASAVGRNLIGDPLVFEIPAKDGQAAKVFCLAKIQNNENVGPFHYPFDTKTNSCPKDPEVYVRSKRAGELVKSGGAGIDGPKSDHMVVEGKKFTFRTFHSSVAFAYPITMAGSEERNWEVVCANAVIPEGSEQAKTKDKIYVCQRESPQEPIKDKDIDKEIEALSIKCPYPERCKERELPLLSVPAYVANKTNPHATDTALTQANSTNQVHPDSTTVKRPAAGGRPGQLPLAPQK